MDEGTLEQIGRLAARSHVLEAEVRKAILEQIDSQGSEVVGAAEIRDLAEAFAWVTNPSQGHGNRAQGHRGPREGVKIGY
jgi:hypothetical protein